MRNWLYVFVVLVLSFLLTSCEYFCLVELPTDADCGLAVIHCTGFDEPADPSWSLSGDGNLYISWISESVLHLGVQPDLDGTRGCRSLAFLEEFDAQNYSVGFRMRHDAGPGGASYGFKVQEMGVQRYALLVAANAFWVDKEVGAEKSTLINPVTPSSMADEGSWNTFELLVVGSSVTVKVNGVEAATASDADPPRGRMNLYFYACAAEGGFTEILVDDFALRGE